MRNGALEILPQRITFDPTKAIADNEQRLGSKLQTLNTVRENQFSLAQAMP